MILTKQMIRDLVVFKGPISVSTLAYSIYKDETIAMSQFNEIMAYILTLESEGVVKYNTELGGYETDLELN